MDPKYHDAIMKIKDYVDKYANEPNIEIEFRLGFKEKSFNTDVGKIFFNKMLSLLHDSLLDMKTTQSSDYLYNGRRLSVSGNQSTCIRKTKLEIVDFSFKGTAFDIRFSISREEPANRFQISKAEYVRYKDRISFESKNWSYDFTTVTVVDNTIETKTYEVELECTKLNLTGQSSYYFCHDAFLKLTDLIDACDPLESDAKVVPLI